MQRISVNGAELEYTERGEGEPLVLVHGSASDYRTWDGQLDEFSSHYRVINYSRRFHWPNEPIPEDADYSMLQHVDDLKGLILGLRASPCHLVGHSYGAFVSLLLAIREPELIKSLSLCEPPVITLFISNKPRPQELLRVLFSRPGTALALMKFGAQGFGPAEKLAKQGDVKQAGRVFGKCILGQTYYDKLTEQRLAQVDANAIKAEFLGSGFARLTADELRAMKIPTLLVESRYSNRLFHHLIDYLEELLPNARRVEIEDASHIMHEDNPELFNKEILNFLTMQA